MKKLSWDYIAAFIDGEGYIGFIPYSQMHSTNNKKYSGIRCMINFGQKLEQSYVIDCIAKKLTDNNIDYSLGVTKQRKHCTMRYIRISNHVAILKLFSHIMLKLVVKQDIAKEMEDVILAKKWRPYTKLNINWKNKDEVRTYQQRYRRVHKYV